ADVAARLSTDGVAIEFVEADLLDNATPTRLVSQCVDRFGRIDCLVNAAGLTNRGSFIDADNDLWETLFAVNARAPFFLMQAAIKSMRERSQGGAIVNILSINTHCGAPDLAVYSATKSALALLTKNAANAHRSDRIRANGINVGWTNTAGEHVMQAETLRQGADWAERVGTTQPFGRLFAPEEVANLAVFLLSDAAGPMTGSLVDQEQWVAGARG
ncbi:MAG: SDR family oxidoreductase, partial [Hyphomicrobiales bacterium]|nr:SDR family oxidoreductase [Hyphomicrobiales bacterium]